MKGHIIAFAGGFLLDMLLGDPHSIPHPVCLMGKLIGSLEKKLTSKKKGQRKKGHEREELWKGLLLVAVVLGSTAAAASLLLAAAYRLHPWLGSLVEMVMTCQILAAKCLKVESMKVYYCLKEENITEARAALSMIVGRDTAALEEGAVARAAIETVAENTVEQVLSENENTSTENKENSELEQKLQSGKTLSETGLPVLMYHFFYDKSKETDKDGNWIEISNFEEQMKYLAENDFYFPTWEQVENYIDGKQELPEKSVVITVDDGDFESGKTVDDLVLESLEEAPFQVDCITVQ